MRLIKNNVHVNIFFRQVNHVIRFAEFNTPGLNQYETKNCASLNLAFSTNLFNVQR